MKHSVVPGCIFMAVYIGELLLKSVDKTQFWKQIKITDTFTRTQNALSWEYLALFPTLLARAHWVCHGSEAVAITFIIPTDERLEDASNVTSYQHFLSCSVLILGNFKHMVPTLKSGSLCNWSLYSMYKAAPSFCPICFIFLSFPFSLIVFLYFWFCVSVFLFGEFCI
jgi:hypothetical protein